MPAASCRVLTLLFALLPRTASAADPPKPAAKEVPAAIVVSAGNGAKIRRYPQETALPAQSGDVLFARDTISGVSSQIVIGCDGDHARRCEVGVAAYTAGAAENGLTNCGPAVCRLPALPRVPSSELQHIGAIRSQIAAAPGAAQTAGAVSGTLLLDKLNRAAALDAGGQLAEAEKLLGEVSANWNAKWISYYGTDLRNRLRDSASRASGQWKGTTTSLVVGVSHYAQPDEKFGNLSFAHSDAQAFAGYLNAVDPGIGARALIEAEATRPRINDSLAKMRERLAGGATGVVFISSHGFEQNGHAYIFPHDAFRTGERPTAIGVETIVNSLAGARAYLFVDACRGPNNGIQVRAEDEVKRFVPFDANSQLYVLFGAGPGGYSYESADLKHGAFTFGLLSALYDTSRRRDIDRDTLTEAVQTTLRALKLPRRQVPHPAGGFQVSEPLRPLMQIPRPSVPTSSSLRRFRLTPQIVPAAYRPFRAAPQDREQLPRDVLQQLSPDRIDEDVARRTVAACCSGPNPNPEVRAAVRIALEEAGQSILLQYMNGEETPPEPERFRRAATYYKLAHDLLPESELLQARADFNAGRLRLFDLIQAPEDQKDAIFQSALDKLTAAQQADPGSAYILNALGIGYLEMAKPEAAGAALRDAIREAPGWAYPWHNLALTEMRLGRPADAIAQYREAIAHSGDRVYLHFNLGLVYQQTNNLKKAAAEYKKVGDILNRRNETTGIHRAMWHNVRGTVAAQRGRPIEAESEYRQALIALPGMQEAKHNLALLKSAKERELLLRDNVNYFESQVELAATLREEGKFEDAISEYRRIQSVQPKFAAARVELARTYILAAPGDRQSLALARQELDAIEAADRNHWRVWLAQAELARAGGHEAEASRDYAAASKLAVTPEDRREIQRSRKVGNPK